MSPLLCQLSYTAMRLYLLMNLFLMIAEDCCRCPPTARCQCRRESGGREGTAVVPTWLMGGLLELARVKIQEFEQKRILLKGKA